MSKYIKIDSRFSISADKFNIILKDKKRHTNKGYSYHSNVEKLVNEIVTKVERDTILVGELGVDDYRADSSELCSSINKLTTDISLLIKQKLEKLKKDIE